MKRTPRIVYTGGLTLGAVADQLDVPASVLRRYVHSGDLVPDERGLYSPAQVAAFVAAHPDL